jgi:hypothetical protein
MIIGNTTNDRRFVHALINKVMIRFALYAAASRILLVMAIRAGWIILSA